MNAAAELTSATEAVSWNWPGVSTAAGAHGKGDLN